ncbi:MAG: hypothetical protein J7J32_02675 [Candidatus Atribacteria bacterium]|nr:hypothetical protein [Candidatus Atribacteria bacterium]MCD6349471.1 hypothetical protein [Candidatus Atribacteria bacterium]
MKKIRIALGSNDGKRIVPSHMGMEMKACMEIFKDADVIIGRKISPNLVKIATNTKFQPAAIETDEISEIMKEAAKNFGKIYDLIE